MTSDWIRESGGSAPVHVYPVRDDREHITNGDPCPCLPRTVDDVVVHNSYDAREVGEVCRKALDMLGVDREGEWSPELRDAYEHAVAVLDMHWPTSNG